MLIAFAIFLFTLVLVIWQPRGCLLYTSDAADE